MCRQTQHELGLCLISERPLGNLYYFLIVSRYQSLLLSLYPSSHISLSHTHTHTLSFSLCFSLSLNVLPFPISRSQAAINTCWTGQEGVQLMELSAKRSDDSKSVYGYDGTVLLPMRVPRSPYSSTCTGILYFALPNMCLPLLFLAINTKRTHLQQLYAESPTPKYPPPPHTGLPVVWINGTRFSTFEQCSASNAKYQAEFIKKVCAASTKSPLPPACHARA